MDLPNKDPLPPKLNVGMLPIMELAWVELVGVALVVDVAELFDGWASPAMKLGVVPEPNAKLN